MSGGVEQPQPEQVVFRPSVHDPIIPADPNGLEVVSAERVYATVGRRRFDPVDVLSPRASRNRGARPRRA
jgi:hypothetical protein